MAHLRVLMYYREGDKVIHMTSKMRTVSFKLPEELDDELSRVARARGQSRSAVVRSALGALTPADRPSVLDIASGLVGLVDGPDDLATNDSYLTDLGE